MNVLANTDGQCTFANALFDRRGMLKQRLYGTFGTETNQGNILYIRNIVLKREYRNQNLGCKALRLFLQMVSTDIENPEVDEWWLAGIAGFDQVHVTLSWQCWNSVVVSWL